MVFPTESTLPPFDEAIYIHSGKMVLSGQLLPPGGRPLVSLVCAAAYALVQNSHDSFIQTAAITNCMIFALLWLGAVLTARQLSQYAPPIVLYCLLSLGPVFTLLTSAADGLFAGCSTIGLAQVLQYSRTMNPRLLMVASALIGLGYLARPESLLLLIPLVSLALLKHNEQSSLVQRLIYATAPCFAILISYAVIYFCITRNTDLGLEGNSYYAFEQGQAALFESPFSRYHGTDNQFIEGQVETRHLFGTAESNHNSVLAAVAKNPAAYAYCVFRRLIIAPRLALAVYGRSLGVITLLFAIIGSAKLSGSRRGVQDLVILLCWPVYTAAYFLLSLRPQFFLTLYAIVLPLTAAGLLSIYRAPRSVRYACAAVLWITFGLSIPGVARFLGLHLPDISGSLVMLLGFLAVGMTAGLTLPRQSTRKSVVSATLILVFMCHQVIEGTRSIIAMQSSNQENYVRTCAEFLRQTLPSGSRVASCTPALPYIADMTYVKLLLELRNLHAPTEFRQWLKSEQISAIYVDSELRASEPALYQLTQNEIGKSLRIALSVRNGQDMILTPKPPESQRE